MNQDVLKEIWHQHPILISFLAGFLFDSGWLWFIALVVVALALQ